MRRFALFVSRIAIFIGALLYHQQALSQVAIGTTSQTPTPDPSAVLLLVGNGSQGLIVPVVTSLGTFGKAGMVVFNSTTKTMHYSAPVVRRFEMGHLPTTRQFFSLHQ